MKQPHIFRSTYGGVFMALVLFSLFCANLSFIRVSITHSTSLLFLLWNLLLAWVPLIFAWLLYRNTLQSGLTWSKRNIIYFIFWLLFLPNAFYLTTDFVHLKGYFDDPQRIFDIVLLISYAINGIILGMVALLLVHISAVKRFKNNGHWLPVAVLLMSGFAIYLGRYLRWNSWDVFINPFGLLFDVSDRIVNPSDHLLTFSTTLLFFSFYGFLYLIVWRFYQLASTLQQESK